MEGLRSLRSFAGRDRELDELERVHPHHAVITVTALPGGGKTLLLLALRERLRARARQVRFLRCEPGASLTEILERLELAVDVCPLAIDDARLEDRIERLVGEADRNHLVLLLDDADRLDAGLLDTLVTTFTRRADEATLVFTTTRPFASTGPEDLERHHVVLEGLDEVATAELLSRHLGPLTREASWTGKIQGLTDGHPLAVRLLIRMLSGIPRQSWSEAIEDPTVLDGLDRFAEERLIPLIPRPERRLLEAIQLLGSCAVAELHDLCDHLGEPREVATRLRRSLHVRRAGSGRIAVIPLLERPLGRSRDRDIEPVLARAGLHPRRLFRVLPDQRTLAGTLELVRWRDASHHDLLLDRTTGELRLRGVAVPGFERKRILAELLAGLIRAGDRGAPRTDLFRAAWGRPYNPEFNENTFHVHMAQLRHVLHDGLQSREVIESRPGGRYALSAPWSVGLVEEESGAPHS